METKTTFMVVKIRFGRGPVVTRRKGKNGRIALLAASILTMIAICFASLGFWRLAEDVELAGGFIFPSGFLSHWQVWLFAAAGTQYAAWYLERYSRLSQQPVENAEVSAEPAVSPGITAKV